MKLGQTNQMPQYDASANPELVLKNCPQLQMPWTPQEQLDRKQKDDTSMNYMQRQDRNFQDQLEFTFQAL